MAEQKQDNQLEPTYCSEDTVCSREDRPEAMNDMEEWRERVSDIRAGGTTWWWCLTPLQKCSECILQPQPTGLIQFQSHYFLKILIYSAFLVTHRAKDVDIDILHGDRFILKRKQYICLFQLVCICLSTPISLFIINIYMCVCCTDRDRERISKCVCVR